MVDWSGEFSANGGGVCLFLFEKAQKTPLTGEDRFLGSLWGFFHARGTKRRLGVPETPETGVFL